MTIDVVLKSDAVRVTTLGADADGVATLQSGVTLYLPLTLPGELIQPGQLTRRGQAWAADCDIIEPSPDRVPPPCPHFGPCGGCALQHFAVPPYAAWKHDQITAVVRRLGYTGDLPPLARTALNERRRIDLAIRREPGGIAIGLHRRRSDAIVDMQTCSVLHPQLLSVVQALRPLLRSFSGLKREGSAVLNLLDTGPDLLLRTDAPVTAPDRARLAEFANRYEVARVSTATGPRGQAETACQLRPAAIQFSGWTTKIPPGAFLQASQPGESAIRNAVLAALSRKPAKARIVELFAGCGTLSHALSEHGRVDAYEGDLEACQALRAAGNPRINAMHRDLVRQPLQPPELKQASCIVLDPPWAGASIQMPILAASRLPIIYVSCNPAALLRDGQTLTGAGYQVAGVTAIDQFLWSARVESVVSFIPPR